VIACYRLAGDELERGTGEPGHAMTPPALAVGRDRQRSAKDERHPSRREPWVKETRIWRLFHAYNTIPIRGTDLGLAGAPDFCAALARHGAAR